MTSVMLDQMNTRMRLKACALFVRVNSGTYAKLSLQNGVHGPAVNGEKVDR